MNTDPAIFSSRKRKKEKVNAKCFFQGVNQLGNSEILSI